jgi:capsid protein
MFEGFKARRARYLLELRKTEIERQALESLSGYGAKSARRLKKSLEDDDENAWINLTKLSSRLLSQEESEDLQEKANQLYNRNVHARNIIRLIVKYVVGRGFIITPKDKEVEPLAEWWKEFWKVNQMDIRKKEIVRRTMRDGEVFIRKFKKRLDQFNMLILRFMDPMKVKPPEVKEVANATHGIETDPDDIEDVKAYWYKDKRISADEVIHRKIHADSDMKRGRSHLEVVAKYCSMYGKWIDDRMKLNMVRSIVGLIRKVSGTTTQAENIAKGYETSKLKNPDETYLARMPEGVSVITTNKGVDYDLKSPNLQAADSQHDGRNLLVAIAAGVGMPEFMVTSDASNANYASTLVSEAPGVMEFEDWQDFFELLFKDIFETAINVGVDTGAIPENITEEVTKVDPETGEVKTETVTREISRECDIVFPEIVHRDILKETQAYVLQSQNGWISDQTAQARLDLDPEEEEEKMRQKEEEEGEPEDTPEDKAFEKVRDEEIAKATETEVPEKQKEAAS